MEFLLKGAISKDNHAKTWYIFAHCVIQMPKATTTPLTSTIFQKSFKDFYEYITWTPNETRASKKYPLPWSFNLFERQSSEISRGFVFNEISHQNATKFSIFYVIRVICVFFVYLYNSKIYKFRSIFLNHFIEPQPLIYEEFGDSSKKNFLWVSF